MGSDALFPHVFVFIQHLLRDTKDSSVIKHIVGAQQESIPLLARLRG